MSRDRKRAGEGRGKGGDGGGESQRGRATALSPPPFRCEVRRWQKGEEGARDEERGRVSEEAGGTR